MVKKHYELDKIKLEMYQNILYICILLTTKLCYYH